MSCSPTFHSVKSLISACYQADNDFISTQGIALGVPFNAGLDNDNQFMVFRVTLPGASAASVLQS